MIAHDVVRAPQMADHPPVLSDQLMTLHRNGQSLVGQRLVATMSTGSHCIDVTVTDCSKDSPFAMVASMLDGDDSEFIASSQRLARLLTQAQVAGAIKSGSAIFIQGTCVSDGLDRRFIAIIKADSDQALHKRNNNGVLTLEYIGDMILGDSQSLYKVAFFVEEHAADGTGPRSPDDFAIKVFDHMLQHSGRGVAAVYFLQTFLRCSVAENAAAMTKRFFSVTRDFIDELEIDAIDKMNLRADLFSFLRSKKPTIQPRDFALDFLPAQYQPAYIEACRAQKMTETISKDTSLLKGRIRRQSIRFTSQVTITAPPEEDIRSSVIVEGKAEEGWMRLKIRGGIEE